MANAQDAGAVRAALDDSGAGAFDVECLFRCSDALQRLRNPHLGLVATVVVDLFLPDSQGVETFDLETTR
jgi:hypothetical protein